MNKKITKTELLKTSAQEIKKEYGVTKKYYSSVVDLLHKVHPETLLKNPKKEIKAYIKVEKEVYKAAEKEADKIRKKAQKEADKIIKEATLKAKQLAKQAKVVTKKEEKKVEISKHPMTPTVVFYQNIGDGSEHKYLLENKLLSRFTRDGDIFIQRYSIKMTIRDTAILDYEKKTTFEYIKNKENPVWKKLTDILKTDENYPKYDAYFSCIVIPKIIKIDTPIITKNVFNPKKKELFSADKEGGMYHKYINYSMNKDAKTFNEMFQIDHIDFVKDNYKANSCFVNLLVDTFHPAFSKNKHYKFNATYQDFCDLLDLDVKKDNLGLTINKSLEFFKKFNIALCVIGVYGIIELFKPEKVNKHITPYALYIVAYNGHCYKLNQDLNSFNKKIWESNDVLSEELDEIKEIKLRNTYYIQDTKEFNYNVKYVDTLGDIFEDMKQVVDEDESTKNYVVYNGNLTNILMTMVYGKPSYIPDIVYECGKIIKLKFKLGKVTGNISVTSTLDPYNKQDLFISQDIYENYHKARNQLYSDLITIEHMSTYNPKNLEIEKKYPIGPMKGFFYSNTLCNISYLGVDLRKAYTYCFTCIMYIPVFDYFDIWKPYDDHKIEDYNQYLVYCTSEKPKHLLLFPDTVTRVTGYKLNRVEYKDYKILHYKKPSKLVDINTGAIIDKLYKTKISEKVEEDINSKKDIFNVVSGLLGKKHNKKSIAKIFKDYEEAFYYQTKFGGTITPEEFEGEDLANSKVFGGDGEKRQAYILEKKCQTELVNGFCPIKDMIYDIASLNNYNTFIKLKINGIKPVGIITDCILFEKKNLKLVKALFDLTDKIGCYKIEYGKDLPSEMAIKRKRESPQIEEITNVVHPITNERDIKEVNQVITNSKRLLLLGDLPGVGKTTTACNYVAQNKLFVCPYNRLCQELRKRANSPNGATFNAITLNMLLGIGCNDQENSKMAKYDVSGYDCIIFDEIFLNNTNNLKRINEFMNKHNDKIFIATGDTCQNSPIGMDHLNVENKAQYLKDCVNQMFTNHIVLKECKRLKNKKDIKKLVELKKDILDVDKDVMDTFRKYDIRIIKKMSDLKTKHNICYFNDRCQKVNQYVHTNLIDTESKKGIKMKGMNYYSGLELVCKEHYKASKVRLFVNYSYVITKISSKEFTICEPVENKYYTLPIKMLLTKFRLPYANTNHSVQGLTIEENYTIFDANTPYINRQWVWTSLTRTDDLNKITIFEHNESEVHQLSVSKRRQYFAQKVEGYKAQDRKANRAWEDVEVNPEDPDECYYPYVTPEWIRDEATKQDMECCLCKVPLEISLDNGTVHSNVTVDRIDNSLPHIKTNCRLTCVKCNCGRR